MNMAQKPKMTEPLFSHSELGHEPFAISFQADSFDRQGMTTYTVTIVQSRS